jgi:hypothetical protein
VPETEEEKPPDTVDGSDDTFSTVRPEPTPSEVVSFGMMLAPKHSLYSVLQYDSLTNFFSKIVLVLGWKHAEIDAYSSNVHFYIGVLDIFYYLA